MGDILDLAERFWQGQIPPRDLWRPTHKSEELAPGVVFFHTWANVTAIRTEAGLVLVDTGNYAARARTFAAVRAVDGSPLYAAVYTTSRPSTTSRSTSCGTSGGSTAAGGTASRRT